jgi:hypothetical protein
MRTHRIARFLDDEAAPVCSQSLRLLTATKNLVRDRIQDREKRVRIELQAFEEAFMKPGGSTPQGQ